MTGSLRRYSELIKLKTFDERFRYLMLSGSVGIATYGFNRYLNQALYQNDPEWDEVRRFVILRDSDMDNVFDLGCTDRPIKGRLIVHHMNPITEDDIINRNPAIFDPELLITTAHRTHNAIHYSDESILFMDIVERKQNDTTPWR